jgi:gamma-butyrobetaine dioxygenase
MFDVTAADNPVNLAYTNTELDFHMDLLYYDTKPGLQVLHCYRFVDYFTTYTLHNET